MTRRFSQGVFDTSVVVDLVDIDPESVPGESLITSITLAELAVGPLVARSERERAARQVHLQVAEADFEPIPFDAAAARVFGIVSADLRASGRKPAARAFDALIAATALSRGLPVFTRNPDDFDGITGLELCEVTMMGTDF